MTELFSRDIARLERADRFAFQDFMQATPPEWAERFGARSISLGDSASVFVLSSLNHPLFNRVAGLGIKESVSEETIDRCIEIYRAAGVTNYCFQTAPINDFHIPFQASLERRGMIPLFNWALVCRGTNPPPEIPTELIIRKIGIGDADSFAETLSAGYDMPEFLPPWTAATVGRPGWSHYMAYEGKTPVAVGALYIRDGIGWVGMGATVAAYRRRGAQGAIMSRRIQDAIAAGCTHVLSDASEDTPQDPNPSYHNMIRCGFELVYLRANYGFPSRNNTHEP